MDKVLNQLPLTLDIWVQSQSSPDRICGGQSGTGKVFFSGALLFPCSIHSVTSPSTFIHLALMLYNLRDWQPHWISHWKLFYFSQLDLVSTYEYWII